jgi:PPOX class probable F420-dependent enzyme
MSGAELARFLADERVVTCATVGPNGRPHLMPLWYVVEGVEIVSWTYAKSQKTRNLERCPQATLQVEAGEAYHELRGAMLECDVEIVRDLAAVATIGAALATRYLALSGAGPAPSDARESMSHQALKRVGLRFRPTRIVTWDHGKLGGADPA